MNVNQQVYIRGLKARRCIKTKMSDSDQNSLIA